MQVDGSPVFKFVSAMANDLLAHKSKSVVVAGGGQPEEVQSLVRDINRMLSNIGKTIDYTESPAVDQQRQIDGLKSLVADMNGGKIETLLILGGNPVYNTPADIDFAGALKKVPTSIHLGLFRNETSRQCTWHLPQAHFLESWGDARAFDGSYNIAQPMIEPLHDGRSAIEFMAMILGEPATKTALDLVQATAKTAIGEDDFEKPWREAVHDGILSGGTLKQKEIKNPGPHPNPLPKGEGTVDAFRKGEGTVDAFPKGDGTFAIENGKLEIVFRPSPALYDGRFANNGWLQEMPDPITRLTWDNVAVMSPKTAAKLGVEDSTLVKLKLKAASWRFPFISCPGRPTALWRFPWVTVAPRRAWSAAARRTDVPSVGVNVLSAPHQRRHVFRHGLERRADREKISTRHRARSLCHRSRGHGRPEAAPGRTGPRGNAGRV